MKRFNYCITAIDSHAGRIALAEDGWAGWEVCAAWYEHPHGAMVLMKRPVGPWEFFCGSIRLWWRDYRAKFK